MRSASALAPQQQIAVGLHADGAVGVGLDPRLGLLDRARERLAAILARGVGQPAPGRIGLEAGVLDEQRLGGFIDSMTCYFLSFCSQLSVVRVVDATENR